MATPLVTALVRTYDGASTLPLAVASVLAQTMDDLECLIVDDGSTDDTRRLVETFADRRVRYVRHSHNRGRAAARRTGIAEARGQFIGLLDGNDWWFPNKLERQLAVLTGDSSLPLVSCGMVLVDDHGLPTGIETKQSGTAPLIHFERLRAPRPCPVPNAPSLIRTEIARRVKTDLSLPRSEDFDFILPILLEHHFALCSEALYTYSLPQAVRHRVHAESARAARRVYAKYQSSHPLASLRRQGECLLKQVAYSLSARLGHDTHPLRRRGRPLGPDEQQSFTRASREVALALSRLVPSP